MFASSKTRAVEAATGPGLPASTHILKNSAPRGMLTTVQAARYLQLSSTYLNKMRVAGSGPLFIKLGRSVRYRESDLEAWVAARCFVSTSAAQVAGRQKTA